MIRLVHDDCMKFLPTLAANSIDTVITDPPYHLTSGKRGGMGEASLNLNSPAGRSRVTTGFMGKVWDGGDIAFRVETWAEVLRVAKPGAFLLAFGGTRSFHRMICAIEDAGWEIRDCMMWLYGSGFPKSLDISKAIDKAAGAEREVIGRRTDGRYANSFSDKAKRAMGDIAHATVQGFTGEMGVITAPATEGAATWSGYGTALKPAWEPIIVAMKPLDGTYATNALKHGVAGLNIDGGRIGDFANTTPPGTDRFNKANCEQGYRPNAYQSNGRDGEDSAERRYADTGGTNFAMKPGPRGGAANGRFPANVILDEEAGALLDAQTGTLISGEPAGIKAGGQLNCYGTFAGGIPVTGYGDMGGASRFFYCAKASADRDLGCRDLYWDNTGDSPRLITKAEWELLPEGNRAQGNTHPTVKPIDLITYLFKLTKTPTGGVVLDPFCGSGTGAVAAIATGRDFIGIDAVESHHVIASARAAHAEKTHQPELFK